MSKKSPTLVLYSGGYKEDIHHIDEEVVTLAALKCHKDMNQLIFSYIPSASYDSQSDYQEFIERFALFGIEHILYHPVDVPHSPFIIDQLFESDVIYLDGGNTFYFLHMLRKNKYLKRLKDFVKRGGILCGLSAGAIIMTPTIETASFPDFDCDDNFVSLSNLKGLNLFKHHFFPHYTHTPRYSNVLKSKTKKLKEGIFALKDGGAIIIEEQKIQFLGSAYFFLNHKLIRLG